MVVVVDELSEKVAAGACALSEEIDGCLTAVIAYCETAFAEREYELHAVLDVLEVNVGADVFVLPIERQGLPLVHLDQSVQRRVSESTALDVGVDP